MIKWLAHKWVAAVEQAQAERAADKRWTELRADPDAECDKCDGEGMVAYWQNDRYYGDVMCAHCGGIGIKPEYYIGVNK